MKWSKRSYCPGASRRIYGTHGQCGWLRVIGDTLFAIGILALGWFVVGLKTGWSLKEEVDISQEHYPSARKKVSV